MDWRTSPTEDTIFYMINSQECSVVKFTDTNSYTALNVFWGLVFLILGVCKFYFFNRDFSRYFTSQGDALMNGVALIDEFGLV